MSDMVGRNFDSFQIMEQLGVDAWGVLFRAHSSKLEKHVILYLLNGDRISQPGTREHALQVAKAAMRWRHPAIARVLEIGKTEDRLYIVRELLPVESLQDLLERLREKDKLIPIRWVMKISPACCGR